MIKKIVFLIYISFFCTYTWAERGYAGGWFLKKIVPVADTDISPIMTVTNEFLIEMIGPSQATIWTMKGVDIKTTDLRKVPYCHPDFLGGGHFEPNNDKDIKEFVKQAGGMARVDKILKKDLGVSFSRFGLVWGIGPGDSGKEPCKSIGDTTFYLTKNKKHVLIFKYPYIYRFDGGYGRIGSK